MFRAIPTKGFVITLYVEVEVNIRLYKFVLRISFDCHKTRNFITLWYSMQ